MHPSAFTNAQKFSDVYLDKSEHCKILEIGSFNPHHQDKAETGLREIFEQSNWSFTGMDKRPGPGVDITEFPQHSNVFDAVVSSSCMEHDPMFWVTFNEMVRVTKPKGLIYICTPSTGRYHGYPGDCWRFMKDSYKALAEWDKRVTLEIQYIDAGSSAWNDNVGIFRKQGLS